MIPLEEGFAIVQCSLKQECDAAAAAASSYSLWKTKPNSPLTDMMATDSERGEQKEPRSGGRVHERWSQEKAPPALTILKDVPQENGTVPTGQPFVI